MPKNIVICGDGTGREYGPKLTNVARLFALLDKESPCRQIGSYYPGVGTMPEPGALTGISRSITRVAGLAFGYGLLEVVTKMYKYLMDHYEAGDNIYLFGFSRGAFTVRALAGLLHRCGLLSPGNDHLIPYALNRCMKHYEAIDDKVERDNFEQTVREFRNIFSRPDLTIRFLGIWDTVKSFGYIRPRSLPHTRNNETVESVRHALALDECRSFFVHTTWGGLDSDVSKRPGDNQDIKEVWFAGSHSDVGGGLGKEEGDFAKISLEWMINEALSCGLLINEAKLHDELPRLPVNNLREPAAFAPGRYVPHQSLTTGWRVTEYLPRWELQNEPPPPRRQFKFGPSGRRRIDNSKRGGKVFVHTSVRWLRDNGYNLEVDEKLVEWV